MSAADQAIDFARRAVNAEARGHGDVEDAMHRLAAKTGVGFWTWWALWNRRRKTVDADLLNSVRGAYLLACQRQIARLQQAVYVEEMRCSNADLEDMASEAEALALELRQKAARAKAAL